MSGQVSARQARHSIAVPDPATPATVISEVVSSPAPAEPSRTSEPQVVRGFENLWNIARDALQIDPPLWVSSLFGLPWTWLPPFQR